MAKPRQTLGRLKVAVAIFMLLGLFLSSRLWLSDRIYPLVPVTGWIPTLRAPYDSLLFFTVCTLLFLIIWQRNPRVSLIGIVTINIFFVLLDQSRLQPWFYQYSLMLVAICYAYSNISHEQKVESSLNGCRALICSVYFWAGVQKFNFTFLTDVFPWLLRPLLPTLPVQVTNTLGLAVALLEMSIGLLLLFPRTRETAMRGALLMHVTVLALIGPFGHNWNTIVWPWNLAMVFFVWILFSNQEGVQSTAILAPKTSLHLTIFTLTSIMPLFSFVGLWDSYLSFKLYSGNIPHAFITTAAREISLQSLSMLELNVPPYPEPRVFEAVFDRLCRSRTLQSPATLSIVSVPNLFTGATFVERIIRGCEHN